mmetsp:Transcript_2141/g.4264  ORF Transcript_2141/g.4264 Transcript_2141/m.4264 type:complete len:128 (+) Transcript_2141:541-924(+)
MHVFICLHRPICCGNCGKIITTIIIIIIIDDSTFDCHSTTYNIFWIYMGLCRTQYAITTKSAIGDKNKVFKISHGLKYYKLKLSSSISNIMISEVFNDASIIHSLTSVLSPTSKLWNAKKQQHTKNM